MLLMKRVETRAHSQLLPLLLNTFLSQDNSYVVQDLERVSTFRWPPRGRYILNYRR